MDQVIFEGMRYPIKSINMPFGIRTISISELNDKLMNDGTYVSEDARLIDEGIFYFVEREYFSLPETELVTHIISEL